MDDRGCACSSSTTTTWSTGASGSCWASSPGSSASSRRAPAPRRWRWPARTSRTWRWSTCSWPASRGPSCAPRCARPRRRRGCSLISGAGRMSPAAARAAGASGFVSKDWDAARVAAAVRRVGLGMTAFPPKAEQPAPLLTEREREVLDLIARGSTNREIAADGSTCRRTRSRSTPACCTASCGRAIGPRPCSRAQRIGLLG